MWLKGGLSSKSGGDGGDEDKQNQGGNNQEYDFKARMRGLKRKREQNNQVNNNNKTDDGKTIKKQRTNDHGTNDRTTNDDEERLEDGERHRINDAPPLALSHSTDEQRAKVIEVINGFQPYPENNWASVRAQLIQHLNALKKWMVPTDSEMWFPKDPILNFLPEGFYRIAKLIKNNQLVGSRFIDGTIKNEKGGGTFIEFLMTAAMQCAQSTESEIDEWIEAIESYDGHSQKDGSGDKKHDDKDGHDHGSGGNKSGGGDVVLHTNNPLVPY